MKSSSPDDSGRPVEPSESLREYARGIAGGLLFSLPLLYTMEVWWAGFIARPPRLLVYLAVGILLLFGYNRYGGLRPDASWREVAFETVEEMGLGLLLSALLLWLLGQLQADMTPGAVVGQVVVEGVTAAIGISVGSAQLGGEGGKDKTDDANREPKGFPAHLALAACGAVLFASNVAPTEEIVKIALEASRWQLVGIAVLSIALVVLVLFHSDFRNSDRVLPKEERKLSAMASRTVVNYAVALTASAFILWFFGRFSGMSPAVCVAQTVVLGVASALGASAGKLLIQPS
jgi:putative integral membrane protein (TIGR02587 family)